MNVVLIRSRRKTLTLTVNRRGEVVLRAPYGVKKSELERFLNGHQSWIEARLAERNRNRIDLTDGSEHVLFGRRYVLANGRAGIADDILYLPQEDREKAFCEFLKKIAKSYMTETVRELAEKYGFTYRNVRISSARGRWGSCSAKGTIGFSFRIAFLPPDICRAVAVHELCHTRVFNHSKAFWLEVVKIVPDYATVRKTLKSYQYVMDYL